MGIPETDGKFIFRDILHLADMGDIDVAAVTKTGEIYRYNSIFFTLDVQPSVTILTLSSYSDLSKAQAVNVPFAALSSGDFAQVRDDLIAAINKI